METYLKPEPQPQEPELKERVTMLEETIKVLMKRIDDLENNQAQPIAPQRIATQAIASQPLAPLQPVKEPESPKESDEPEIDIDDVIMDIEQRSFIHFDEFNNEDDTINYDKYVEK